MASCNDTLLIIIKPKTKYRLDAAVMMSYVLQNSYLKLQFFIISAAIYHFSAIN